MGDMHILVHWKLTKVHTKINKQAGLLLPLCAAGLGKLTEGLFASVSQHSARPGSVWRVSGECFHFHERKTVIL